MLHTDTVQTEIMFLQMHQLCRLKMLVLG